MSLKRNCDGCGAVIDDGDTGGRDYPDMAVYVGDAESPAYEYEDLCPKCMGRLICAIENALIDCDIETGPAPDCGPERLAIPAVSDTDIDDTPLSGDTASSAAPQPVSVSDGTDGYEGYANGVVRQFPIKSARATRSADSTC